jgi:hypothetical protein
VSLAPGQVSFTLRIQLEDVEPAIWRRLLVPGEFRLSQLHDVFQAAMGWRNSHLHSFTVGDAEYGMQDEDAPDDEIDEASVTVVEVLGDQERFSYVYDFGDDWVHEVTVESQARTRRNLKFAVCIDGANACPPEDCGGPSGYDDLRRVLADPTRDEHEELLGWVGGSFDPSTFDLAGVNADLQRVR